eukprot:COSAG01_NODE_2471_length_7630_cov_3.056566_6_plen_67_part_00
MWRLFLSRHFEARRPARMLRFGGSAMLRHTAEATETSPPPDYAGGWWNTTVRTDAAMLAQLQRTQR